MAKCDSCVHFCICERYQATVDFDVDDGVCRYYEKEVVRCGECIFMEKMYTPDGSFCGNYCCVWVSYNGNGDDGYCNYGERKDNE